MVSKVQPELLRQVSVNKLLGANSMTLQNAGVAAHISEVMHILHSSTPLTGRAIKPQRQGHIGGPIAQP